MKKRRNQKIPRDKWKRRHNDLKSMGCSKSSSKREVYRDTSLSQEKSQTNNLTLHLKQLEKEQTKPIVSRGKKSKRSEQK